MSVLISDAETRTIHCPCGAQLEIVIQEDSELNDREQEDAQINDAQWEIRDAGYFCKSCKVDAPLSYLEEIDRRVDLATED